ncbi:MAG: 2'-deoxycytidine 5'-triphosphate deaminase [Anaerolineae bacterium]
MSQVQPVLPFFEEYMLSINGSSSGVLPSQALRNLVGNQVIYSTQSPITEDQIQPASIDLRLSSTAYCVKASFLPGKNLSVLDKIKSSELLIETIDITSANILQRGSVYIIPLQEVLCLPPNIIGRTNPKSTTGRLDIFVRVISDKGTRFDELPKGYNGELFAEIVPRSFDVKVAADARLTQLRLERVSGRSDSQVNDTVLRRLGEPLVYSESEDPLTALIGEGLRLTARIPSRASNEIIGYKAISKGQAIDLRLVNHYPIETYWQPINSSRNGSIILNPGDFYILTSKERVRIPNNLAAEMVSLDQTLGEFRVHYAGFFDPGFGEDIQGTYAVLEVRAHEAPFLIEDGQEVARLVYHKLTETPDKLYGSRIGSSYQGQGLNLAKQFKRES